MRIFLSWSGELSREIAEVFKGWLPRVLQSIDTFMSEEDILLGTRGLSVIGSQLSETNVGILFITQENKSAPWLNFEAGALSKSFDESNVIPILIDLKIEDIKGPIGQFQGSRNYEEESIRKLVFNLNVIQKNTFLEKKSLDQELLKDTFNIWYPQLEKNINEIIKKHRQNENQQQEPTDLNLSGRLDEIYSLILRQNRKDNRESTKYITQHSNKFYKSELLRVHEMVDRALIEYKMLSDRQFMDQSVTIYLTEATELLSKLI